MVRGRSQTAEAETLYERIGQEIKRARGDLTQTQLAVLVDSRQGTISDWEVGRTRIALDELAAIERVLGLAIGTILARAGYLPTGDSLEDRIRREPWLTPEQIGAMLNQVDYFRRKHAEDQEPDPDDIVGQVLSAPRLKTDAEIEAEGVAAAEEIIRRRRREQRD